MLKTLAFACGELQRPGAVRVCVSALGVARKHDLQEKTPNSTLKDIGDENQNFIVDHHQRVVATAAAQRKTALAQKSARSFPKAGKIALVAALPFSGALSMLSQSYQFPVPTTSGAWEESQSAYLRGNGYHFYNFQISYPGTLTLETTGNIDTWGYLWDNSGGYLDYDENSGSGSNFRISRQVSAGLQIHLAGWLAKLWDGLLQRQSLLCPRLCQRRQWHGDGRQKGQNPRWMEGKG